MVKLLDRYAIDTVISAINLENEAASTAQLNLIAAADKSVKTRRFIPGEFVSVIDENDPKSDPGMGFWVPSAQALRESSLEYTRFATGFFMDYWGMPHVRSHLKPGSTWGVDMVQKKAVIPGTGNDIFSVTYSVDLAKFIVRSLDTETWPEYSIVSGSDINFNEFIAIAERVRASKFHVVYDGEEKLQKNEATLLSPGGIDGLSEEAAKSMMAHTGLMIISGRGRLPTDNRLNDRFPDIHTTTLEELLKMAWEGK